MKKFFLSIIFLAIYASICSASQVILQSRIVNDFQGFNSDAVFIMQNGTAWQQSRYTYDYSYKYHPQATIIKHGYEYILIVDGVDEHVTVDYLGKAYEESISGEFDGWDGDTIFKLSDGSIWEQIGGGHESNHHHNPDIYLIEQSLVYKNKNIVLYYALVEDSEELVQVQRIK